MNEMTAEEKLREDLKQIVPADAGSMEKAKQRWKTVGKLFSAWENWRTR